jgi:hypothetical protein
MTNGSQTCRAVVEDPYQRATAAACGETRTVDPSKTFAKPREIFRGGPVAARPACHPEIARANAELSEARRDTGRRFAPAMCTPYRPEARRFAVVGCVYAAGRVVAAFGG